MRKTEMFIVVLAHVLGVYLAIGLVGGIGTGVYIFGPSIEVLVSPVVRFRPVDHVYRDKSKACFALHITKAHAAVPLKYSFSVEAKLSALIPVSAYLVRSATDRTLIPQDLQNHTVGTSWTRVYCFGMPSTIADNQEIRVTGAASHRRHPFWTSTTPIPPFNIPPLADAKALP